MINFDLLTKYLEHDTDIIEAVLVAYLEDHHDFNAEFTKQLNAKDWQALGLNVHTLKGVLSSFGETTITPVLERVEFCSKQQEHPAQEDIDLITIEINKINQQIEEYVS
ncbi:Hpt domain-containing protein [Vibrio sinensis]|uniref:Hpt domain-containing protein n=1 Tax=Vibrio sinensis TaxID=2302434 RepID=A0A3A6QG26_9VIBR|nr:Hpt domain-containing protein [Vibrio sinensis]RJX71392.1 Hpt domain-containing protein [Vibrio sinensis]